MRLLKFLGITLSLFLSMRVKASGHESSQNLSHESAAEHFAEKVVKHTEEKPHEVVAEKKHEPSPNENKFEVLNGEKSFIDEHKLIYGEHWIRNSSAYHLQTPYGDIESRNCDFYVSFKNSRVTVVTNLGKLKVILKDGGIVEVPPGFTFWFSEIKPDKKNLMGFIQPVDLKDHILALGKLWTEDQESFKDIMLKFQSRWGDRTLAASQYYKGLALRKIASIQKEDDRVHSIRRQESERRTANRKLLYERAFGR